MATSDATLLASSFQIASAAAKSRALRRRYRGGGECSHASTCNSFFWRMQRVAGSSRGEREGRASVACQVTRLLSHCSLTRARSSWSEDGRGRRRCRQHRARAQFDARKSDVAVNAADAGCYCEPFAFKLKSPNGKFARRLVRSTTPLTGRGGGGRTRSSIYIEPQVNMSGGGSRTFFMGKKRGLKKKQRRES